MMEQLITFETAKLAKEKGFNEKCGIGYDLHGNITYATVSYMLNSDKNSKDHCSAPTQTLLQKWLRDVHDIHINPEYRDEAGCFEYFYTIMYFPEELKHKKRSHEQTKRIDSFYGAGGSYIGCFDTYEEALEEALQKSLKLI
jgi:hypothetical protein